MASYLVFSMQKQRKIVQDKIESKIWLKYKKKRNQKKTWLTYYIQKHDNNI